MTIWEAAVFVLNNNDTPMYLRDIYDSIIKMKLYTFKAQKPLHVLNGEIRRHCENINFPTAKKNKYFVRLGNGSYALNNFYDAQASSSSSLIREENEYIILEDKLEKSYKIYRDSFKKLLLEELKNFSPLEFEQFSKNLLKAYGFSKLHVTAQSRDGGIDGYGLLRSGLGHLSVAFQCKRWTKSAVGRREIDQFRGAISGFYDQGIFFTTSIFSKDAIGASSRKGAVPIILVDGDNLVETMLEKEIGIIIRNIPKYEVSLDDMINEED